MNIMAIIPARLGSRRLPRKNVIEFNGKPLIQHTIDVAKQSQYVNKIIISTNDPEVEEKAMGADIFRRPESLATDTSRTEEVIIHVVDTAEAEGYIPDIIVLLQPTSPLRNLEDIDRTIEAITQKGADSAQTISEVREHPGLMVIMDNNGHIRPLQEENHLKRSQELQKIYIKNGSVYACTRKTLEKTKGIYGERHLGIVTPRHRSIDIDTQEDLEMAKYYLKKK